jgi:hypothetical protein
MPPGASSGCSRRAVAGALLEQVPAAPAPAAPGPEGESPRERHGCRSNILPAFPAEGPAASAGSAVMAENADAAPPRLSDAKNKVCICSARGAPAAAAVAAPAEVPPDVRDSGDGTRVPLLVPVTAACSCATVVVRGLRISDECRPKPPSPPATAAPAGLPLLSAPLPSPAAVGEAALDAPAAPAFISARRRVTSASAARAR